MSLKKKFHQDLEKYATPSAESLGLGRTKRTETRRRKWLSAPIAIAMSVVLVVGAAAGVPALVKLFNDDVIIEHNVQLTEVPEGYAGIYTVEDLVKLSKDVDNDCEAENYILMADITFTDADYAAGGICEGGWRPIGYDSVRYIRLADEKVLTYDEMISEYKGDMDKIQDHYEQDYRDYGSDIAIFNGNGHIIRNLKINTDITTRPFNRWNSIGFFANASKAQIINLGIEGIDITVTGKPEQTSDSICVGGIAGKAEYVGASYVKDVNIKLDITDVAGDVYEDDFGNKGVDVLLRVGGVVGQADYVDACYTESFDIDVSASGDKCAEVLCGGVVSKFNICVSSWADGTFAVDGTAVWSEDNGIIVPASSNVVVPTVMTVEGYEMFEQRLIEKYGSLEAFDAKMVRAYFTKKSIDPEWIQNEVERAEVKVELDKWNKYYSMATGVEEYQQTLFVFDPMAGLHDAERVKSRLSAAFESEQEYLTFCRENTLSAGLKYGATIQGGTDGRTEENYPGFDFEKLWVLVDGVPRLRIFQNS